MRVQVQKIWFFLFLLVSILLCASARNTFFASDEEIVGKARMLRTYYLNDYDNPSLIVAMIRATVWAVVAVEEDPVDLN
ncbi:Methylxanthine N3-demethylase NdmB [Bienertia sinuspersici]